VEARASFPPDVRSASEARHFAERTLGEWGLDDLLEATRLLVSELVVNAVVHAGTESELVLKSDGASLHVEVLDRSTAAPVLGEYSPTAPGGRGLLILDELADQWGVDVGHGSKTVWFELARRSSSNGHRPVTGGSSADAG